MSKKPFVIGIAGGSGSGKTFFLKCFLNHFKENELNKIAIHIYTSLRDIDIESFFRAAWYHKREACKIIYEMAYKDNNDILILKFDNIMRKMKQVS